jgi:hypothetical protein
MNSIRHKPNTRLYLTKKEIAEVYVERYGIDIRYASVLAKSDLEVFSFMGYPTNVSTVEQLNQYFDWLEEGGENN